MGCHCEDKDRHALVVVTSNKGELTGLLRQVREKFGCDPKSITRKSMRASASKLLPTVPTRFMRPGGGIGRGTFGNWKAVFVMPEKELSGLADFVGGVSNEQLQAWAAGEELTEALDKTCSTKAFGKNYKREMDGGRDQSQAFAIAISTLKTACGVDSEKRMSPDEIVAKGTKKESTARGREMDVLTKLQEQTEYLRLLIEQVGGRDLETLRKNVLDFLDMAEKSGGMDMAEANGLKTQAGGADVDGLTEMWINLTLRFPYIALSTGPTGSEIENYSSMLRSLSYGPSGVGA